jgi:hypothetical protein
MGNIVGHVRIAGLVILELLTLLAVSARFTLLAMPVWLSVKALSEWLQG